jgi:hypothetical protein
MSTPFLTDGALVRVTGKSVSGDAEIDAGAADVGDELTVYSYAEGKDGDDPNGLPYYLLDGESTVGGDSWAYPEHLTVVKTAAELASRRPPSLAEIQAGVSGALIGMYEPIEVDATDHGNKDGDVVVYGRTADGLRVGFRIRIDQIEETDF